MESTVLTRLGVAAAAALLGLRAPAMAHDTDEDRLAVLEQRIKYLEDRLAAQDRAIVDKESEIAALSDGWFNRVSVGGTIELELVSEKPAGEDSTTSADVGTVELAIGAGINDEWSGEVVVENDDGTIALLDAFLTYDPGSGLSAAMGQQTLPFGVYETNLVSDPLTLELGETAHTSLVLSGGADRFDWFLLGYHDGGDTIDGFGIGFGTVMEGGESSVGLNAAWLSDIGDSDGLDGFSEEDMQGMSASAQVSVGPVSAIVEFVAALESNGSGAEPSAWHAEAAYGFDLMGREAVFAVGTGGTEDAAAAELAETLTLAGISVGIADGIGLGVEWSQREGYDGGGADEAITVLLAAEF